MASVVAVIIAADTGVVTVLGAGSTVVAVAADVVVAAIYRRARLHACHVVHHDHLCHYDDRPILLVDLPSSA